MISMLGHYLNKTVLVSIPAIFANDEPQPCKLIGIEPAGLWLGNDDLTRRAFAQAPEQRAVFVPFPQIAYLAAPASPDPDPGSPRSQRKPRASARAKKR
jgi:hypothetical protein